MLLGEIEIFLVLEVVSASHAKFASLLFLLGVNLKILSSPCLPQANCHGVNPGHEPLPVVISLLCSISPLFYLGKGKAIPFLPRPQDVSEDEHDCNIPTANKEDLALETA